MTDPPIGRVLADEVLWYSQRDGWGHLHRYDLRTGALLGQVTSGQWAVRQILHVNEAERVVYFTASGLAEADPYRRTVCRAGLDGSGFAKVTDDELDHIVTMPDSHEYFIDSAERFRVKAADGATDIYGVLYRPRGFDPAQRYPVVDSVYPGPQVTRVAPCFHPGGMGLDAEPPPNCAVRGVIGPGATHPRLGDLHVSASRPPRLDRRCGGHLGSSRRTEIRTSPRPPTLFSSPCRAA